MSLSYPVERPFSGEPRRAFRATSVAAVCLVVTFCACRGTASSTPSSRPRPVESVVRGGGATMTVRAERDHVAVAERFDVVFSVVASSDTVVTFPSASETLGDFTVTSNKELPPIPDGSLRRTELHYQLECDLSGEKTIPAITITLRHAPASQSNSTFAKSDITLISEPLTIEVTSELVDNTDLTKFRDIKGPMGIPTPIKWLWVAAVVAALLLVGLMAWRLKQRRAALAIARRIPAHELARLALDQLAAEQLAERGAFHEYYFRLSGIVRQYIEGRFGLMAPERTTEEFLIETRRSDLLSAEQKQTLGAFLQVCDEVKFALYQPSLAESERAMQTARDFVNRTTPVEAAAA